MKQIIGSVLTLSILLLLGILHLQRLETIIHTTNAYLEQALLAEGSSEAAASAGQAAQYWNGVQTFLGLTLRHDQLDQVSEELTLLKSYAQSKESTWFLAQPREIKPIFAIAHSSGNSSSSTCSRERTARILP